METVTDTETLATNNHPHKNFIPASILPADSQNTCAPKPSKFAELKSRKVTDNVPMESLELTYD